MGARGPGENGTVWGFDSPPPGPVSKAVPPALAAFLADALAAITRALLSVLPRAWTEGWVLGQLAAQAVVSGLDKADWAGWTPGDYAAAQAIAGEGLSQLLAQADVTIQSIAETRIGELAAVLEATLASDETSGPVTLSVGSLTKQLADVLDNPSRARVVAQAEIGRAQAQAARTLYSENGVAEIEISTAEDSTVCPACEAAKDVGPHPVGTEPLVLLHPGCRCAELPVLAG